MFHMPRPNLIESTEGFSVEILGRTGIQYVEGDRTVEVNSEVLATDEIAVYRSSIRRWKDGHAIDEDNRSRIIHNIRDAVKSQGEGIVVI